MLKKIGKGLLAIVVLLAGLALYIHIRGIPTYTVTDRPTLTVEVTPERVVRGKRWVSMLCAECHKNPETQALTGRSFSDLPPEFGMVWVPNITQDKAHGIGTWTDAELAYLLRTGVKRDGQYAPPWMAKLPNLSDDDLLSIIAFLRSDDPWVRAQPIPKQPSKPSFLAKALSYVVFKPLPYPKAPILAPPASDPVRLGRYFAASLDCYGCHSADFKTINVFEIEKSGGFMGGGNLLLDTNGRPAYTPNITPEPETGIGRWSEADFVRALKDGFRPDKSPVRAPMARYPELTDEEAKAIYAYLRTVPPIKNTNKPWGQVQLPGDATAGDRIYHKYACTSCHGESGLGSCDLRTANRKYKTDVELMGWIRNPEKLMPGTKMPTWDGVIAEEEYAPLTAHVRKLGGAGP